MADEAPEDSPIVRLSTSLFAQIEHVVYLLLGILLSIAAVLALGGAALALWHGLGDWSGNEGLLPIIDKLLFVLLLIEVLHTVRASIRTGGLTPEPFLIVGLIASIRRVLVITLQTSEATKASGWTQEQDSIVRGAMLELGVIGGLILILVVSLYLLARCPKQMTTEIK